MYGVYPTCLVTWFSGVSAVTGRTRAPFSLQERFEQLGRKRSNTAGIRRNSLPVAAWDSTAPAKLVCPKVPHESGTGNCLALNSLSLPGSYLVCPISKAATCSTRHTEYSVQPPPTVFLFDGSFIGLRQFAQFAYGLFHPAVARDAPEALMLLWFV